MLTKHTNTTLVVLLLLLLSVAAAKMSSVHSAYVSEVHDVPMAVLIRPLESQLDERKVESLMDTIRVFNIFILCYF